MLGIALLGCGRIGRMHAGNIAAHPRARLAAVFDVDAAAASAVGAKHAAPVADSAEAMLAMDGVEAVLIASATPTHADCIELAAAAAKPALCEKPIDLSLERVDACARRLEGSGAAVQIGFNRRFDPGHRAAREAAHSGEIGDLHQVVITSRDPEMPPRAYYEAAGGLLRDMTIHDFDLARHMLGEEPTEVFAIGGRQADPQMMEELGDHDSAMIAMRTESGRMCSISNSRSAVYGYDQRVELLCSRGMAASGNRRPHEARIFGAESVESAAPYQRFFVERYRDSFEAEIGAFVDAVESGTPPEPGFEDGRRALVLAEAAIASIREERMVKVSEIG